MHINEVIGFARKVTLDTRFAGKNARVFITAIKDGTKYYMGNGFVTDRRRAFPYHYDDDKVGDQIEQAAGLGMELSVEEAN